MKRIRKVLFFKLGMFLMILLVSLTSWAQQSINGRVVDSEGQPLPGVTVVVKGTTQGTVTNGDGEYTLPGVPEEATLQFSFVGMRTQEVEVGNQTSINITMEIDAIGIEEVVAVGYGTMRKVDLTGAVASVKGDKIEAAGAFSAAEAMQGKLAGVQIVNSGEAGAEPKIRIRGVNTIGNNDPLIVVDGITNGASLQDINPADIESIDVLKDASALAIFGSRASNGVIMITTKRGNYGAQKMQVNLKASYGIASIPQRFDMVSSSELVDMIDESRRNENMQIGASYRLYDEIWPGDNWGRQDVTDWQDELFNTGIVQDYSLSAVGGSEKATYAFSVSYRNQEGTMPGNFAERFVLRGSTETKVLNDKLKLGSIINYSVREQRGAQVGQIWHADVFRTVMIPGNIPAYFDNGKPYQETDSEKLSYFVPGDLYQNNAVIYSDYFNPNNNIVSTLYADLEIIEGLNFRTTVGQNYKQNFFRNYSLSSMNPEGGDSNLEVSTNRSYSFSWDNVLTFDKQFGDLKVNVMAGTNTFNINNNGFNAARSYFPPGDIEGLRYLDFGDPSSQVNGESASNVRLASYFGRINLNYGDKYLFTATVRRDGSSRFHRDVRWGTFPSLSAGWLVSEEDFLSDLGWLDMLKLRAGWGQVGNQNVGSDYAYISTVRSGFVHTWQSGDTDNAFGVDSQRQIGKVIWQRGNENVTWETTTMANLGLDFAFSSINGSLELFQNNTTDILLDAQFPDIAGYYPGSTQKVNSGEVQTRGFDFSLDYSNNSNEFKYTLGANFTYSENEIISLAKNEFVQGAGGNFKGLAVGMSRSYVGDPIGAFYGWNTTGIFNTQAEVDAANENARQIAATNDPSLTSEDLAGIYYIHPKTAPGDYIFEDIDGDGIITAEDQKYLGSGNPKMQFGINFSANYKAFDFALNLTGVAGVQIYSMFEPPLSVPGYFASLASIKDHWTPDNPTDNFHRYTMSDPNKNIRPSNKWIHDANYLRVQNIILGYTLPESISSSLALSNLRFYVNVQNLYTITSYPFLEPEVIGTTAHGGNQDTSAGVDVGSPPVPRTIMFGLNVNF